MLKFSEPRPFAVSDWQNFPTSEKYPCGGEPLVAYTEDHVGEATLLSDSSGIEIDDYEGGWMCVYSEPFATQEEAMEFIRKLPPTVEELRALGFVCRKYGE